MAVAHPTDYAIVVGIDSYASGIPVLQGCVNDALLFRDWLLGPGGLDPKRIKTFSSLESGAFTPTKDNVEDEIVVLRKTHRNGGQQSLGRRLYMFFAGHGVSPRGDANECALVMANATDELLGRSIPGRKAAEVFCGQAVFDEVVLLMDCCREVAGLAEISFNFNVTSDSTLQRPKWLYGFAAQWGVASAERLLPHPLKPGAPPSWHGVFTHAVLEGLTAAVDGANEINSDSFDRFVSERVNKLSTTAENTRPIIDFERHAPERWIKFGTGQLTTVKVRLNQPAPRIVVIGPGIQERLLETSQGGTECTFEIAFGRYIIAVQGPGDSLLRRQELTVFKEVVHVVI